MTDQGGRPVWIDNDVWEKMSNKNMYRLWTENEYNSDRGRVRLNPNGPDRSSSDADARSGFSIIGPNLEPESAGTIMMGGVAVAALDGPELGPADLAALAYIIGALGNLATTHEYQNRQLPLGPILPPIFMSTKDVQKSNPDKVAAAEKAVEELKGALDKLKSTPNKTPEIKKQIEKIAKAIKKAVDDMKKSEPHGIRGKRN